MNFTYEKNETGKHMYKLLQTFSSANELSNFVTTVGKHNKVSTFYLCIYLQKKCLFRQQSTKEGNVMLNQTACIMTPDAKTSYLQLLNLSFLMCKMEITIKKRNCKNYTVESEWPSA